MRTTFKVLFVALLMSLVSICGSMTAAQAQASGNIAIHNQGDSQAWLDVNMLAPSGSIYSINLNPGQTAGEPSYNYYNWEPGSYYVRAGWCVKYRFNDGPVYQEGPASSGYWNSIYPGSGFTGTWMVYVKTWNC